MNIIISRPEKVAIQKKMKGKKYTKCIFKWLDILKSTNN